MNEFQGILDGSVDHWRENANLSARHQEGGAIVEERAEILEKVTGWHRPVEVTKTDWFMSLELYAPKESSSQA